jgi:hypothetical protein
MAYGKSDVSGVGGWLAVFLLTFAVILPIAPIRAILHSLYGITAAIDLPGLPGWLHYRTVAVALCTVEIAICWLVAWRLLRVRNWNTVRLTIIGILLISPGFVLIDMAAATTFFGVPVAALPKAYAGGLGRAAAYSIIWITYFLRSQRVANTYPRPSDEHRLTAVFS